MPRRTRSLLIALISLVSVVAAAAWQAPPQAPDPTSELLPALRQAAPRWWKGHLHTHSLWSDGDDFPQMIADWYKRHGYQFLGLSDHSVLSEGEEITHKYAEAPVHINAVNLRDVIKPLDGANIVNRVEDAGDFRHAPQHTAGGEGSQINRRCGRIACRSPQGPKSCILAVSAEVGHRSRSEKTPCARPSFCPSSMRLRR